MAKITRATQKIFGQNAGANQIGVFGSKAAAAPAYSTNAETIQSLSQFLSGWNSAVIGQNSPAIQDMNALFYLYAYQLAYIMQTGTPEWDAETTYYIGSLANDGTGKIYKSIQDTNLNHAVTDTAWWLQANSNISVVAINPATQSPYSVPTDSGRVYDINSLNGATTFTLPLAVNVFANFVFTITDVGGIMGSNFCTIVPPGTTKIMGLNSNYICRKNFGSWTFYYDGTDYWLSN